MKANPGGAIDLQDVIGRGAIIADIWDTIENQSIRMNAERRIGKTTIIRKLEAEPTAGWCAIYQDLEKHHSAAEFALGVYRQVDGFLSQFQRAARRTRELLEKLAGTKLSQLTVPRIERGWKDVLTSSIEDLMAGQQAIGKRLLFLWDEVPLMISSIKQTEGVAVAKQVLDVLRGLRQTHPDLRMIATGSIGMHHVLKELNEENYRNAPRNDLYPILIPPLEPEAARELTGRLIDGEALQTADREASVESIVQQSDCFPFYIHHIVKALKLQWLDGSVQSIDGIVTRHLTDGDDPWELHHYRQRIPEYYGREREPAVVDILDSAATRDGSVGVEELLRELKNLGSLDDRDELLKILRLLDQDHYLIRESDGQYRFQFPLLKRWWKLARAL